MRNMSFSKTTKQMYAKMKFVTRRYGWWFLNVGDRVQAVEKAMGLKRGEKVKKICVIEIVSVHPEALCFITPEECVKEGFPDTSPEDFRELLQSMCPRGTNKHEVVNRIEFEYVDDCSKCIYGAEDHVAANVVCCYYGSEETNSENCPVLDPKEDESNQSTEPSP